MRLRLVGDVVFTTPAVHALRRRFPDARLDYLVEPAAAAVVRHSPDIDSVIEVARPRGLARIACDIGLARRLRRERYDLALDFHGGPRSAWLVRASGATTRIGYDIPGRRFAYTTRVPWHPLLVPPRHSVLNQWDLLTPLGLEAPTPASPRTRRSLSCMSAPATRFAAGPATRSPASPPTWPAPNHAAAL